MRCPHCSGTMDGSVSVLDKVGGKHGELQLSVTGIPAHKCPKGHASPIDEDFMIWLMQELKDKAEALPGGEAKGMLFKKYFCTCGKELPGKSAKRHTFPAEVKYEGKYAIQAGFDLPMFKCEGCGKEQIHSATNARKDVSFAMADVTDEAGFPHSG